MYTNILGAWINVFACIVLIHMLHNTFTGSNAYTVNSCACDAVSLIWV